MSDFILPDDVNSPKQHWQLIKVLDDGATDRCALAIGKWDNELVLGMRWNGYKDNPIGNPQSRGIPTWFIVPKKYREALLTSGTIAPELLALARGFFPEEK